MHVIIVNVSFLLYIAAPAVFILYSMLLLFSEELSDALTCLSVCICVDESNRIDVCGRT